MLLELLPFINTYVLCEVAYQYLASYPTRGINVLQRWTLPTGGERLHPLTCFCQNPWALGFVSDRFLSSGRPKGHTAFPGQKREVSHIYDLLMHDRLDG